ncbi:fam-a protein [Plasmodium chabaudi chabaudi]|uniref:Fam-a protein n=1 Tax=Plasmodium chabaudi chabaudi TaxID=31271 RepID=A0A1D3LA36_PLACU|nr:fam-a protein [Plasmodium chabaudi chabaudi]
MNKFYIQIVLFILSIFVYANNETLATEPASGEDTKPKLRSRYPTPEEIYEKNKHLLRSDHKHTKVIKVMGEIMDEAIKQLEYHATCKDGYKACALNHGDGISYYKKKHDDNTDILKINLNIYASSQYDEIINKYWDPDTPNTFNEATVKIFRVYNPNLLLICQRYKKKSGEPHKYFYAFVSKTEISKDKTIIAMTSSNTTNENAPNIEHKNPILKKADTPYGSLRSKNYIEDQNYKKAFVNLAGYLIEKKGDDLEVTYIESIDGHSSI